MSRTGTGASTLSVRPGRARSYGLLVGVPLVVLLLLVMSLPRMMQSENPWSEANLLFLALLSYLAASAYYVGFVPLRDELLHRMALGATAVGLLIHTAAVVHRSYTAGRPPFSNMYEMLVSFAWGVVLVSVIFEKKYKMTFVGSVTLPIATLALILTQLMPSEIRPLMPALQSTWLHIHVTFAMFAYAACAVSFALALLYLVKDGTSTNIFLCAVSAFVSTICVALLTRLDPHGGLLVPAWDVLEKREIFLAQKMPLMVSIPGLGYLFAIVLAVSLVPLLLVLLARPNLARGKSVALEAWARRIFVVATLLQIVAVTAFVARAKDGSYFAAQVGTFFPTRLSASPFLVAGMASALFASALMLLLLWRRETIESILPEPNKIDLLTYKTIAVAFPLLTIMIATGAYWANRTWGSYWSWDPKETWALVTWLVYAGYLHARLVHGWRGRRAAYLAIIGFAVVIFTFFGVSYLLPGLHAYA